MSYQLQTCVALRSPRKRIREKDKPLLSYRNGLPTRFQLRPESVAESLLVPYLDHSELPERIGHLGFFDLTSVKVKLVTGACNSRRHVATRQPRKAVRDDHQLRTDSHDAPG